MTEIHWLAVYENKPHTTLEGRSQDLTVHGGTAWMEITHDASFNFTVQEKLCYSVCLKKKIRYLNIANTLWESTNLQSKNCLLIPLVPTVRLWWMAHRPPSRPSVDSLCLDLQSATDRHWLCELKNNISHLKTVNSAGAQKIICCRPGGSEEFLPLHSGLRVKQLQW